MRQFKQYQNRAHLEREEIVQELQTIGTEELRNLYARFTAQNRTYVSSTAFLMKLHWKVFCHFMEKIHAVVFKNLHSNALSYSLISFPYSTSYAKIDEKTE